jgi:enoyl-CoA hydratase/carnithine racemase
MLNDLAREITEPDLMTRSVIILRSVEPGILFGASFVELAQIKTSREGKILGFAHVINSMRKCPKFIVARVHGKCVRGGVVLVAAWIMRLRLPVQKSNSANSKSESGPLLSVGCREKNWTFCFFTTGH